MHPGSGAGRGAPLAVGERWPHAGAWCAFLGRQACARAIRSWVRNTREGLAAQPALSLPRLQDLALGQDGECRQQDAEQAVRQQPGRVGTQPRTDVGSSSLGRQQIFLHFFQT